MRVTKLPIIFFTAFFFMLSCNKKEDPDSNLPLEIKARYHLWVTYYFERNGVPDNAVAAQKPTFDFRTDGNLYFSQINPVFKDTFSYQFTDGADKLVFSRYPISSTKRIIFTSKRITDTEFDFTVQETGSNNIDFYKTRTP